MAGILRRLGGVVLVLVGIVVALGVVAWRDYNVPGPLAATQTVVVPKNARLPAIATTLAASGVIAHPWFFVAVTAANGRGRALKAGEYQFAAAITPRGVADLLASGKVVQHRFTLAPGLTSAEAAALLKAARALDGTIDAVPPEGSLYPDTYFYVLGTSRAELVKRMTRAMDKALAAAWAHRAPGLPYADPRDALVMASIIEKETAVPDERGRVAGVYVDRLRLGMKLDADPTVIYALSDGGRHPLGRPLDHADLATASPYNTYAEKGLPPTPIDNPGLASITAALAPEDRGELYFVADGSGRHVFAKTLVEQNRNVGTLRRLEDKSAGNAAGQH